MRLPVCGCLARLEPGRFAPRPRGTTPSSCCRRVSLWHRQPSGPARGALSSPKVRPRVAMRNCRPDASRRPPCSRLSPGFTRDHRHGRGAIPPKLEGRAANADGSSRQIIRISGTFFGPRQIPPPGYTASPPPSIILPASWSPDRVKRPVTHARSSGDGAHSPSRNRLKA